MVSVKRIETASYMKDILKDYFLDIDKASNSDSGEKIAWCSSAGPSELLRGMGLKVFYPENHSAILGASRFASDMIPIANAQGYSPDICTYLTSDIGAFLSNFTPLTQAYGMKTVPKPDVLVYNTNQCRDVQDWFRFYAKYYDIPLIGVHSPSFIPEVTPADIKNVSEQMKGLIPTLEKVTDQSFDLNKLKETIKISKEAVDLWEGVLRTAQNIPTPITFFDATIHMAPIVVLRGTEIAVEYYRRLKTEMDMRVEQNIGALEEEQVRVFWDGMPLWGKLRSLSDLFAKNNTSVVASTYCNSWAFDALNPNDPFEGMARAYTELFINRDESFKQDYLKRMAKDYKIDGFVYHDCKTCPNNSNNRYQLPQRLQEETGLPFITINGDVNDLRLFSEEQSHNTIEAFVEQISVQKELYA